MLRMIRLSELKLPLNAVPSPQRRAADAPSETEADRVPAPHPLSALRRLAAQRLGLDPDALVEVQVHKRSFDARKADIQAVYIVDVSLRDAALEAATLARLAGQPHIGPTPSLPSAPQPVARAVQRQRPVVVGFGPCGIFAALMLARRGLCPIVLERGRPVRERTQDTWGLWRRSTLNPESNVQFGEGGAGTFSDGKLWSQIRDPEQLGRVVLQELVEAGAPPEILYEAHPHIGTFKLVKVVQNLRASIEALGGEIRFGHKLVGLNIQTQPLPRQLRGVEVLDQGSGQRLQIDTDTLILAPGHSARDTFAMLHEAGVLLQAKPFSIGFRIEHPQSLIDRALWGRHAGHPLLGAAAYKLVHRARNGRTVYSFCMCPGGTVVAATSEPGRVVTNGMSQYSRAERNANAGLVVGIEPSDYGQTEADFLQGFEPESAVKYALEASSLIAKIPHAVHPLAGINLQRQLESGAFALGGGDYHAPAQLVGDFIQGCASSALGDVIPSYRPGVRMADLGNSLPEPAIAALREALPALGQKIKGFDRADAVLTGVETRTSSPLRAPRGPDLQSLNTRGLFPGGEGAGYAGGILSAAVDGIRLAQAVAEHLSANPGVDRSSGVPWA
ncbi:MAG: NAD(P)/FAD-dependent oxidoreductase [Rhodoferax sp.]